MSTRLIRAVHFECLHRYENPEWTSERNKEVFGACYSPHGHGHSYKMEVCVSGSIAPDTGMVMNLKDLDQAIQKVVKEVDQKHLNFEVDEFKSRVPTTENLARFLFAKLKEELDESVRLEKIRLYENDDLWVDEWNSP